MLSRRHAAICVASTLALVAGCSGGDRAVRVTFDIAVPGDALCVVAGDGRMPTFVQRYPVAELPEPASLTFVAGSPGRQDAVLGAVVLAGGRVTGTGHLELDLSGVGALERSMRVDHCREGTPTGLGVTPSGTFSTLATTSRLHAADFDGDGREELFGIAEDGALAMLEAEDPGAGSRSVTDLSTTGGRVVGSGDFDGDCRVDLLAAAPSGVLRVRGRDGTSPSPVGPPSVADVTVVQLVGATGPMLAAASPAGTALVDPGTGASTELDGAASTFVAAADLDGDGLGDLLAGGAMGSRLYRGGATSISEEPGAGSGPLAAATGPAVSGDFDGDGLDDLAVIDVATIRVLSYGGGSLAIVPFDATFTTVVRIAAGDLDGDCTADLVVLDEGVVRFFRGGPTGFAEGPGPSIAALDVVIADVDGDGAREAAILGAGRRVSLWRP